MKSLNACAAGALRAPDRVILKFAAGVLPATPAREPESRYQADARLAEVMETVLVHHDEGSRVDLAGLSVRRHLEGAFEVCRSLVCSATTRTPSYREARFQDYVEVSFPDDRCAEHVAESFLRQPREVIEHAYVLRGPAQPPLSDVMPSQLRAAPGGVGATAAWRCPGGVGEDVLLVDVEQGWFLAHGDLPAAIPTEGVNLQYTDHGGKVLGVLFAKDGGNRKTLGIARASQPSLVSEWRGFASPQWLRTEAIYAAAAKAREEQGDIVLLEAQTFSNQPVEIELADQDAIRTAVANGIIVVEPAGNSGAPLPPLGEDSGAIVVGAAEAGSRTLRSATSGHGERVDCYAPANLVRTIAVPNGQPVVPDSDFLTGTSAAAAVVAGMAACIQGIAKATRGKPLSPAEMRDLLRNRAYGSPVYETANDTTPIGHIPDLEKICRLEFGLYIAIDPTLTYTFASPNTVAVTVQSTGTLPLTEATLSVYWAPANGSPSSDWQLVGSGDLNGVAPGASYTASFPWPPVTPPAAAFVLVGVVSDKSVTKVSASVPTIPHRIAWST